VVKLDLNDLVARLNRYVYSPISVGHQTYHTQMNMALRVHPAHSVHLIVGGWGRYVMNHRSLEAKPGSIFFFVPGMLFEWESSLSDPLEFYNIRFDYAEAYRSDGEWRLHAPPTEPFPFSGQYPMRNTVRVANLFEHIFRMSRKVDPFTVMNRNIAFQQLLLFIAEDILSGQTPHDGGTMIESSIEYMMRHFHEELRLESLADQAGWSVGHYCKMFKKITGYSPKDYIIRLRIDRAKELLEFQQYRLKEIAASVGYDDEFYFSRIFKKITGVSPSEYVRR
jgi:AraC-like DNA-binding protein/mannose-6-phosphate isomerase-like protein (cupin superfamily)